MKPDRMKGVAGYPLEIILGLFVTSLLVTALVGTYPQTFNFYKEQMTVLQDDRVTSAVLAMGSMAGGHLELDLRGEYELKNTGNQLYVRYASTEASTNLDTGALQYYDINGPGSSYVQTEGVICLRKSGDTVSIEKGEC